MKWHKLDDLLPNLVIVFERSKNLKVWLCFTPQKAAVRPRKKKKILASYLYSS